MSPARRLRFTGKSRTSSGRRPSRGATIAQAQRHTYAALDLGTNNCRLLIARPVDGSFTVIDAFSRIVRLGEGMSQSGRLSDEAMDRAVAALAVCADKLRRRNVSLARSVATEACRRAANGRAFVERVREETGIVLEVIEPQEEARLAMLGCHKLLEPGDGPALIFDIGGGSTELVLVDHVDGIPKIRSWWSAPWGVVSLTESEGPRGDRGQGPDARLQPHARAGAALVRSASPRPCRATATTSACSGPAAR